MDIKPRFEHRPTSQDIQLTTQYRSLTPITTQADTIGWSNNCWLDHLLQRPDTETQLEITQLKLTPRNHKSEGAIYCDHPVGQKSNQIRTLSSPAQTSQLRGCQLCEALLWLFSNNQKTQ